MTDFAPGITADEANALPHGTLVWIRWSGGNGPHTYTIERHGSIVCVNETRTPLTFVGPLPPFTQVWLSDPQASPPHSPPPQACER